MKRTQLLSIAVIAVMALTVVSTAGVLAAPKAAAQTPAPEMYLPIDYKVGKTYVFWPWQYNMHYAIFSFEGTTQPKHTEWSKWATEYAKVQTTMGQEAWDSTEVAMLLQLKDITPDQLSDPGRTCTVKWKISYTLAAKGDKDDFARVVVYPSATTADPNVVSPPFYGDQVSGDSPNHVKTITKTLTWTGPVGYLFGTDPTTQKIETYLYADGEIHVHDGGQATVAATVYEITLKFNQPVSM